MPSIFSLFSSRYAYSDFPPQNVLHMTVWWARLNLIKYDNRDSMGFTSHNLGNALPLHSACIFFQDIYAFIPSSNMYRTFIHRMLF